MIAAISDWLIRIPGTRNVYIHVFQLTALAVVFFLLPAFVATIAILVYGSVSTRKE
jgi:hypothetical protein